MSKTRQVVIVNPSGKEKLDELGDVPQVVLVGSLEPKRGSGRSLSCSAVAVSLFVIIVGLGVMMALVAGAIW